MAAGGLAGFGLGIPVIGLMPPGPGLEHGPCPDTPQGKVVGTLIIYLIDRANPSPESTKEMHVASAVIGIG